jgi:two-component system response regulator NreC
LTVHEDEAMLREAIRAGASGYIVKHAAEAELIAAIETIRRGDLYVDPAMLRVLLVESTKPRTEQPASPDPLTPRETDVLKLIVQGYTNRQVGEELGISVRTVEGHRANLLEKLGLRTRVELVRYARDRGLIS